jgi:signal transduction histidine kinase
MNVLANAIDASPNDGEIRVELFRLAKTEANRDWLRVRVIDHGTGIAPEDLKRIFQPYFTTKKTGDEERGFGLGLAISRKIATLHGGNLVVQSEFGRGTMVDLDLPNRHKSDISPAIALPLAAPAPKTAST